MKDISKDKKKISLICSFLLCLVGFIVFWSFASQISYLIYRENDSTGTGIHPLIFGALFTANIIMFIIGVIALKAKDIWGEEICSDILGINPRILKKSEVLIFITIFIGTLFGSAAWDFVTIINALIFYDWYFSVFLKEFVIMDFFFIKIMLPLWLHAIIAAGKCVVASIFAGIALNKINKDTFCEGSL